MITTTLSTPTNASASPWPGNSANFDQRSRFTRPKRWVLAWDFETEAVETKLTALGETPQTYEVAKLTAEVA